MAAENRPARLYDAALFGRYFFQRVAQQLGVLEIQGCYKRRDRRDYVCGILSTADAYLYNT